MFSQASIILSTGGVCMVKGACVAKGGHVWQRGHVWKKGACVAKGGMCGKVGHAWRRRVCVAKGRKLQWTVRILLECILVGQKNTEREWEKIRLKITTIIVVFTLVAMVIVVFTLVAMARCRHDGDDAEGLGSGAHCCHQRAGRLHAGRYNKLFY